MDYPQLPRKLTRKEKKLELICNNLEKPLGEKISNEVLKDFHVVMDKHKYKMNDFSDRLIAIEIQMKSVFPLVKPVAIALSANGSARENGIETKAKIDFTSVIEDLKKLPNKEEQRAFLIDKFNISESYAYRVVKKLLK